jgi:predicted AAA+ superfamily ATPase
MAPTLIDRPLYMAWIASHIDTPMAKVLTGMRRSGKSALLDLTAQALRQRGVPDERILQLNFDSLDLADLTEAAAVDRRIHEAVPADGTCYVLLDEVQEVAQWERLVNSLMAEGRFDIYLTGSNANLLSTELATYIAGRYVALEVSTLSFAEHLTFSRSYSDRDVDDTNAEFTRYVRRGGFPGLHRTRYEERETWQAVGDIYTSTLIKDALTRHRIRNPDLLQRVAVFALDNVGSPFSVNSITRFMRAQQRPTNHQTVADYMAALSETYLVTKVSRYDLRGKAVLAFGEKYYVGDHGFVSAVLGYDDGRLPGLLENIVWAELRRRGYTVHIGKEGEQEVDLVGERYGERMYVQVATTALDPATRERERRPLLALRDSFPKYIVTLDTWGGTDDAGIRYRRIPDFLLDQSWSS